METPIMTTSANFKQLFKEEAQTDIDALINNNFINRITFGNQLENAALFQSQLIKIERLLKDQWTKELDEFFKDILKNHLEIGQQFSRVWSTHNPDIDELFEIWKAQSLEMERWKLFMSSYEHFNDLEKAYDFAYKKHPVQLLMFSGEDSENMWKSLLKYEHQQFIKGKKSQHNLEVFGQLEPTQLFILNSLMSGNPVLVKTLIKEALGKFSNSPQNRANLSRRISEINKKLVSVFGKHPSGKWIRLESTPEGKAYRLYWPES